MVIVHTISLTLLLALKAVLAQSFIVIPKAINATSGSVSNAEALLAPNTSLATLSGKGAQIVLDYGVNVGGFPILWIDSVEGEDVQMAATYSEGITQYSAFRTTKILIRICGPHRF